MADENEDGLSEKSDAKSSVGDIFGVSSGQKKKKKKKKKAAEEPKPEAKAAPEPVADEPSEPAEVAAEASAPEEPEGVEPVPGDDEATTVAAKESVEKKKAAKKKAAKAEPVEDAAVEEAAPKKKKKSKTAAVDGVLLPGDPGLEMDASNYLGPEDLGDYDAPKSKTVPILIGIIVLLVAVIGVGALFATGQADDLGALFRGELREKRIAEARMDEERHMAEQLEKLEKFGNLMINGSPQYALIKLNGQKQFGQTSAGWRELRIGTTQGIQDVKVKQDHVVEFSSPGFEPFSVEITEGKWEEATGAGYVYSVSPTLLPSSIQAKQEFDARMSEDEENEFYGKVSINTIPSGAKIIFNNKPLLNEKGEELKTPVSFDKYWVKDEESGKLEEQQVRVDTTFDVGHKIQLAMEYPNQCAEGVAAECGKKDGCCSSECNPGTDPDCQWPEYVTSLMRPMWTCNWVDGEPPADIAKDKTIQHYCDYSFTLDLDFSGLKNYIIAREEERKRVMEQFKAAQKEGAEQAQAAAE